MVPYILPTDTLNEQRIKINNLLSSRADFNILNANQILSGNIDLSDIITASSAPNIYDGQNTFVVQLPNGVSIDFSGEITNIHTISAVSEAENSNSLTLQGYQRIMFTPSSLIIERINKPGVLQKNPVWFQGLYPITSWNTTQVFTLSAQVNTVNFDILSNSIYYIIANSDTVHVQIEFQTLYSLLDKISENQYFQPGSAHNIVQNMINSFESYIFLDTSANTYPSITINIIAPTSIELPEPWGTYYTDIFTTRDVGRIVHNNLIYSSPVRHFVVTNTAGSHIINLFFGPATVFEPPR